MDTNFFNEFTVKEEMEGFTFFDPTSGEKMNPINSDFDKTWEEFRTSDSQILAHDSYTAEDNDLNLPMSQGTLDLVIQDICTSTNGSGSQNVNDLVNLITSGDSQNILTNLEPPMIPINGIPSNTDWPGEYNFDVTFSSQDNITKGTSWIYSSKLKKLFAMPEKECSFEFRTTGQVPSGTYIRAMPMYTQAQHLSTVVQRCPNHSTPQHSTNIGHPAPNHFIRCHNKQVYYQTCPTSERLSVVTPYETPQPGTDYSIGLYSFMCFVSCVGRINRRDTQIVFTLENDGVIIGRKSVKIRSCACPKRDMDLEETGKKGKNTKEKLTRQASNSSVTSRSVLLEIDSVGPQKKRRRVEKEKTPYTITVYKKEHQIILQRIARALMVEDEILEKSLHAAGKVPGCELNVKPIKQEIE